MDPGEICMPSEEQGSEVSSRTMGPEETCLTPERQCFRESTQDTNCSTNIVNQENIEGISSCYICQTSTQEDDKLRKFSDRTWATVKNASGFRAKLTSDKYFQVTQKILVRSDQESTLSYHPSCHKNYTAVKRPKESPASDDELNINNVYIKTRRCSVIPKSDHQGLLKGTCVFCGKSRKKKNGKEEPRLKIATVAGCDSLCQRAMSSTNERIKSLIRSGVDLIAKEAEYHKSCRVQFLMETESHDRPSEACSSKSYHKRAFASLLSFIQNDVLGKQRSVLVSDLLDMYKEEYTSVGGDGIDVLTYTSQNLARKVKDRFKEEITVKLADKRKGNFIFCSALPEEDATARLHEDAKRYKEESKLRWAALHLRSQIMQLPKTKTPNPATVQNVKECAADIPGQLDLFFRILLGGMTPTSNGAHRDTIERKVTSMASDAIYNVTHGTVKPWKHTSLGLGFASLTGSKLAVNILNRTGHCISYSETKGLETEFAYSVEGDERDAPDGIRLEPNLATACVWDNNDADVETLDGKETLHATVGHTYQNILDDDQQANTNPIDFREERNRRKFAGNEREIPPFRKSINKTQFLSTATTPTVGTSAEASSTSSQWTPEEPNEYKIRLKVLDLYWFWKLREGSIPLHAGFMSEYIKDPLPLQRICYMDPISRSPTNNDVVRETMIRTMKVAKETGQDYAVVTYDLAVALKAYSIQAIESPLFDKLLIMLGNFHVERAFYGAVGTLINESGIEFILTEADILAEGSMMGFIKGKFYNRCTRIHELIANVLEQKLYKRFHLEVPEEDYDSFQQVMSTVPLDPKLAEEHLSDPVVVHHLQLYEDFFQSIIDGNLGLTAQFWGIYIFLINRLHRELQRCVKTNDVDG